MKPQILVIGLGQFGMALVEALSRLDVEIFAVDQREDRVRAASAFATEVAVMDATSEAALAKVAPNRRDLSVCAIGDEAREASIICTALLRQLGAPRVFARASDELHERILRLVGAHEVENPERAFGQRIALHLAHKQIGAEFQVGHSLILTQLEIPAPLAGRTLVQSALRSKHGLTVVAIERGKETLTALEPSTPLKAHDLLIVVATRERVTEFVKAFS